MACKWVSTIDFCYLVFLWQSYIESLSLTVKISLTYVFGLGAHLAKKVCDECCVPQDTKMSKLDQSQLNALSAYIRDNIAFEGDLRKSVSFSIILLADYFIVRIANQFWNAHARCI